MSTRAVYSFQDSRGMHHVYVHHDGYPIGAAEKFERTLTSALCWPLPRFEADEFAASFVAANKTSAGSIRLTHGPNDHADIEYAYKVSQKDDALQIKAMTASNWTARGKCTYTTFWKGPLAEFISTAKQIEEKLAA